MSEPSNAAGPDRAVSNPVDANPGSSAVSGDGRRHADLSPENHSDWAGVQNQTEIYPQIPGYRLLQRLGQGGQGQVWKARRDADGPFVALKIIRVDHQEDPIARARFEYEYQVLSGEIDHPYIVRALDHGLLPTGELWLATEYVSGRTIHEYVNALDERGLEVEAGAPESPGAFPVRALLKLFAAVCEAVEAAHRHGIIHRDLKPSNILVDDEHRPRLVDFGLARPVAPRDGTLYTVTGQFVGTPPYASPEQADSRLAGDLDQLASRQQRKLSPRGSAVDVRSDIYSLGVILYELVTGLSPYGVDSPSQVTREMILSQPPVHPREIAGHVDRDLEAILLKALAKDPVRRYQAVAELREDIEALLAGRPVRARGERLGYLLRARVRRHRFAAVGLAVALLLSVLYAPVATVLYRRANAAQQRAEHNARMARETTEWVITQVDDKLKDTIGMGDLRTDILRDAYEKLKALAVDFEGDGAVDADLARSLTKLSDVALAIGKTDEAEEHRRAALAIWQKLVQREPNNPDYLEGLSIGQVLVGDIHHAGGERDKARSLYNASLAIDERLVRDHPDNNRYLDNLAWSYERIGVLAPPDSDLKQDCFTKRHEAALELVRREPDNPARQINLCASYLFFLQLPHISGDHRIEYVQPAAEIATSLIAQNPLDSRYLQHYAATNQQLCGHEIQHRRALDTCIDRLHDIDARISVARAAEPDSLLFLLIQANNLCVRAHVAAYGGHGAVALTLIDDALALFAEAMARFPNDPEVHAQTANCAVTTFILANQPDLPPEDAARVLQAAHDILPLISTDTVRSMAENHSSDLFKQELAKREQTEPRP